MRTKNPADPTNAEMQAQAISTVRERSQELEFFHDRREAYATVPVADHRETWPVNSVHFRLWVMQILYEQLGSAPKRLIDACLEEFRTHAICGGKECRVFVRTAEHNGAIYIDLVNDRWQVLEVGTAGWHILDDSPVKFRREGGMKSLPYPQDGGDLGDLCPFLNVGRQNEILLLAWLTYSLLPSTPYPIVALSGVHGSAKSTTTKVLRKLTDPSDAELATLPKSEHDLAITAAKSHLITIDNLSEIPPWLSDAMCRVATGGSFRTRRLYTTNSEMIFTYRRPQIINGIGIDELPIRPDFLDRSIWINVEPISEESRRDERTFWSDFERACPRIFGGMLNIICEGIRRLPCVKLSSTPRMADFTRWGVAVEQAMGFPSGAFLAAYRSNREDANAAALDSSPVAEALLRFLDKADRHVFHGTALQLLSRLRAFLEVFNVAHPEIAQPLKHPKFPKSANQLSAELIRIKPNLEKRGITVDRGRVHGGRYLHLERAMSGDASRKRDAPVKADDDIVTAELDASAKVAVA